MHGPIWEYIYGNRVAIGAGLLAVISAGIKTAPAPGQSFSFYTWGYDFAHQFFNITNTRLTPGDTPPKSEPKETQS
jgi:hypothetical protein